LPQQDARCPQAAAALHVINGQISELKNSRVEIQNCCWLVASACGFRCSCCGVSKVSVIYSLSRKFFLWFSGGQELEMDEFSARLAEVGGPGEREQGLLNSRKSRHLRQTRHQIVRGRWSGIRRCEQQFENNAGGTCGGFGTTCHHMYWILDDRGPQQSG
jgi:hypothetical protein